MNGNQPDKVYVLIQEERAYMPRHNAFMLNSLWEEKKEGSNRNWFADGQLNNNNDNTAQGVEGSGSEGKMAV